MSTFSSISSYSHWRFLAKITLFQLLPLFNYFILLVEAPCPFQNPFWFVDKPMVASVFDENGEMVPNKVRVMWNRMENFKCVDYFQVEYFQRLNPRTTVAISPNINRHRKSVEIEVVPCTDYFFKVIASENWKGLREDFKVFSEVVGYRNEYTPKFINPPVVREKRPKPTRKPRRGRGKRDWGWPQDDADVAPSGVPPAPEVTEKFSVNVRWRLSDVDYPVCLDYFVLDYYDNMYNETSFTRTFSRPFVKPRFELNVPNNVVPCDPEFEFNIYAYGFNKKATKSHWTPPACIITTTPPTTTTAVDLTTQGGYTEVTTESLADKLEVVEAENERLQAKIDGLKQEYEKIGLQVFLAFKEHFFAGIQDFIARRNAGDGESNFSGNQTDPMFS